MFYFVAEELKVKFCVCAGVCPRFPGCQAAQFGTSGDQEELPSVPGDALSRVSRGQDPRGELEKLAAAPCCLQRKGGEGRHRSCGLRTMGPEFPVPLETSLKGVRERIGKSTPGRRGLFPEHSFPGPCLPWAELSPDVLHCPHGGCAFLSSPIAEKDISSCPERNPATSSSPILLHFISLSFPAGSFPPP